MNYCKAIWIYNNFFNTYSKMCFALLKKNYRINYRMILDEYIQLSNAGIAILNHVLLTLVLMTFMTSFLIASVNASHGNFYWAFLLFPNQCLNAVKTNSNYIRHFLLLECPGNCETCRSGPCSRWCSSANWCGDSDEHKTTDCRMCRFGSMRQNQINLSIE